jgi:hypothetical protein
MGIQLLQPFASMSTGTCEEICALTESRQPGDEQNISLRTLLIACYYNRISDYLECSELHAKHVLWIIENAPHIVFAGERCCMLMHESQAEYYQQGKELWQQAKQKPDAALQVFQNAIQFWRCRPGS